MRETDVEISPNARTVTVKLCARSVSHGLGAIASAENETIPGYSLGLIIWRPYRPRGGRKRRLILHYHWTDKPEHHVPIDDWEQWAKLLERTETTARGRGPTVLVRRD